MNKETFGYGLIIVLTTLIVLTAGFFMGQSTRPRYIFQNGGQVQCNSRC